MDEEIARQVLKKHFQKSGINYDEAFKIVGQEAPIPCFLAVHSKTGLKEILKAFVSTADEEWQKVIIYLNINLEIFFPPVPADYKIGQPFGAAYGMWAKFKKDPSKKIYLSDNEVLNLVYLNIVYEHFKLPVVKIMNLRAKKRSFSWIIANQQRKQTKANK